MKYIFIPEKTVFSHAFDSKASMNKSAKWFLDFCANQKSLRRYYIAVVPLSLMKELEIKKFFKNTRAFRIVSSFIDSDKSICTSDLDVDIFKLAEIKAIQFTPVIVANREETFSKGHITFIRNTDEIMEFINNLNLNEDI